MCGIAGLLRWDGTPVSAGLLRTLGDSMVHRAPPQTVTKAYDAAISTSLMVA